MGIYGLTNTGQVPGLRYCVGSASLIAASFLVKAVIGQRESPARPCGGGLWTVIDSDMHPMERSRVI